MDLHLLTVLLSWTISLSSYPHPHEVPEINYQPQQFFVDNACAGNKKCRAAAWYDDKGTIFLHERIKGNTDAVTRSVVVHELVHYLQDLSGEYKKVDCDLYAKREREAYAVQRTYINKIAGRFMAIYVNYPPCNL
jgi:hypothetical protein